MLFIRQVVVMLFVVLVLAPTLAFSEPSSDKASNGRLPDGRAYRIDASGYRLIDEMAELEVTANEQREQVQLLEAELAEKERTINQLKGAKGESWWAKGAEEPARSASQKLDPPKCNELVSSLYIKVSQLENEIKKSKAGCETPAVDSELAKDAQNNVQQLESALKQGPTNEMLASDISHREDLERCLLERQALAAETARREGLERSIKELTAQVEQEREKNRNYEKRFAENTSKVGGTPASRRLQTVKTEVARREASRAALVSPLLIERSKPEESGGLVQEQTVSKEQKAQLLSRLNRIQVNIIKRKDLLDSVRKQGQGASISLQPLNTSGGQSLDQLRQQIGGVTKEADYRAIDVGLEQISKVVLDDIAVLQRLQK